MQQLVKRLWTGQEVFLRKHGAYFWFPKLTQERFFLFRIGAAVLCTLGGIAICLRIQPSVFVSVLLGGCVGVVGFFLPKLIIMISDKRDNEQMMSDVRKLYEYVKIQVKAGMHLTHTLSACYLAISNRRLKQGLLELNSRLIATNSVSVSISEFKEKFTNEYISYFCLVVAQSEQSGRMAQMLDDITKQMEDMQRYLMAQKKGRMERKLIFLTLLVFLGILLIAGYQLATSLIHSMIGIMG